MVPSIASEPVRREKNTKVKVSPFISLDIYTVYVTRRKKKERKKKKKKRSTRVHNVRLGHGTSCAVHQLLRQLLADLVAKEGVAVGELVHLPDHGLLDPLRQVVVVADARDGRAARRVQDLCSIGKDQGLVLCFDDLRRKLFKGAVQERALCGRHVFFFFFFFLQLRNNIMVYRRHIL